MYLFQDVSQDSYSKSRTLTVFALVNETPAKTDSSRIANPAEGTPKHSHISNIVSNHSKPSLPATPLSSLPKETLENSTQATPKSRLLKELELSESDSESSIDDDTIVEEFNKLQKKFKKRKAIESPESSALAAFEKVLTKKQRKKLRKSLEKQK